MEILKKIESIVGAGRVKKDQDISPYLTLKTKTIVDYYFEAKTREDLINAYRASAEVNLPFFILGGGSNVVFTEERLSRFVVHNRYSRIETIREDEESSTIAVTSGYPVGHLVKHTVKLGLSGFEYHLGLPGTVGGAIYMNSKWTHPLAYFGDLLVEAVIITKDGSLKKVNRDYFQFAYDHSILQLTHEIVLEAEFKLKKMPVNILEARSKEALAYRKKTQPFGVFSSGCFFRNISHEDQKKRGLHTTSAGFLIDQAGLKGRKKGNYYVSPLHANFILNKGEGDPKDLKKLLHEIKQSVYEKFGLQLKEEVIII